MIGLGSLAMFLAPQTTARGGEEVSLSMPSIWDKAIDVRAGGGFNDNVLLSGLRAQPSGFVSLGLSLFFLRLPIDGTQLTFFFEGEDRRYLADIEAKHQQWFFTQAELRRFIGKKWQAGVSLLHSYQDEITDVSAETVFRVARVRGNSLTVQPGARREFGEGNWVSLDLLGTRQWLDRPLDDYWEGGPRLVVGHDYGRRSDVTLRLGYNHRVFDTWRARDAEGLDIPDTRLRYRQPSVFIVQRHHWDSDRKWRTRLRLGYQPNLDNGSGWYDYHSFRGGLQLRYRAGAWEVAAGVNLIYYDYPVQTTNFLSTELRDRLATILSLRVERNLVRRLKVYATYEYEVSDTNVIFDEYDVNVVSLGLDYEI